MKNSFYIRCQGGLARKAKPREIFPSHYLLEESLLGLEKGGLLDDDYILCTGYKHGDMQVGVTGSIDRGKNIFELTRREISRKTSIDPGSPQTIFPATGGRHMNGNNIKVHLSITRINSFKLKSGDELRVNLEKNINRKIIMFLVGDKKTMIEALSSIDFNRVQDKGISYFTLIHKDDLLTMIDRMKGHRCEDPYKCNYKPFLNLTVKRKS